MSPKNMKVKNKSKSKEKDIRRKQLEADLNAEINKDELSNNEYVKMEEKKYNLRQRMNSNDIFPRPQQINKSRFIIEKIMIKAMHIKGL